MGIFLEVVMTICERVFELLSATKGKSAAGLCKELGLNTSVTTNWKNRGTDPPAKYIVPICEYLGVSVTFLLTGEEASDSSNSDLGEEESELLDYFRSLDTRGKRVVLVAADQEHRRVISEKGTGNTKIG